MMSESTDNPTSSNASSSRDGAQRRPVILAVDDDSLVLQTLTALFAIETDYDLRTALDPAQALAITRGELVDVIVSDFMMPGVNGVELLRQVREVQPDAPRILLTGYADKENAIKAINEAGLYHYLEKPWENDDLLLVIRNALEQRNLRGLVTEGARELSNLFSRYSALDDRHRLLEREVDMAARVQRSLLPAALPESGPHSLTGRWEPSTKLGGDFYDVHESDDRFLVLLADVSGHGVPAALAATLLKSSFHEAAEVSSDPATVLADMNQRLGRFMPAGLYACALVAEVDSKTIRLANAGLPFPRVRRAKGDVETVVMAGMPLALLPSTPDGCYDQRMVELSPGDMLLLTTDGLAEARNSTGVQFDEAGLKESFCGATGDAESILTRLVEDGRAHSGKTEFDDDVSLVLVRRR